MCARACVCVCVRAWMFIEPGKADNYCQTSRHAYNKTQTLTRTNTIYQYNIPAPKIQKYIHKHTQKHTHTHTYTHTHTHKHSAAGRLLLYGNILCASQKKHFPGLLSSITCHSLPVVNKTASYNASHLYHQPANKSYH